MKNPGHHFSGRRHTSADLAGVLIRNRRLRERYFAFPFHEPGWDMLLDLERARRKGERVSIKSLCLASCVPPTTALRYIDALVEAGLIERSPDPLDGRRSFITLTEEAANAMSGYLEALELPFESVDDPLDVHALLDLLVREAAKTRAPKAI